MRTYPLPPRFEYTSDRQTNEFQRAVARQIAQLTELPPATGVYVEGVVIQPSGNTVVQHNLGRPFIGWTLCRLRKPTVGSPSYDVYEADEQPSPSSQLTLVNGLASSFTADVWVF